MSRQERAGGNGGKRLEVGEAAQMAGVAWAARVGPQQGLFALGSIKDCLLSLDSPDSQKEGWDRRMKSG